MTPSNRTNRYKYTNWCSREEKSFQKLIRTGSHTPQAKTANFLEASNLRAFYKLYIISNQ